MIQRNSKNDAKSKLYTKHVWRQESEKVVMARPTDPPLAMSSGAPGSRGKMVSGVL